MSKAFLHVENLYRETLISVNVEERGYFLHFTFFLVVGWKLGEGFLVTVIVSKGLGGVGEC